MDLAMILDQLQERLTTLILRLVDFLPDLLAALLVLGLGWVLARFARAVVRPASKSLLTQISRLHFFGRGPASGLVEQSAPRLIGDVAFWVVLRSRSICFAFRSLPNCLKAWPNTCPTSCSRWPSS
jgi:hypothetical protein